MRQEGVENLTVQSEESLAPKECTRKAGAAHMCQAVGAGQQTQVEGVKAPEAPYAPPAWKQKLRQGAQDPWGWKQSEMQGVDLHAGFQFPVALCAMDSGEKESLIGHGIWSTSSTVKGAMVEPGVHVPVLGSGAIPGFRLMLRRTRGPRRCVGTFLWLALSTWLVGISTGLPLDAFESTGYPSCNTISGQAGRNFPAQERSWLDEEE